MPSISSLLRSVSPAVPRNSHFSLPRPNCVRQCSRRRCRSETTAMATQIRVVETSLYVDGEEYTRVLRHLGIRAGDDGDFIECHWGPAEGSFREGFLNCGEGEISDSPYMGVFPCGETKLSKDEIIDWCKKWTQDRVYALVGQNCWSMVHEFLTTHEGCEVPDSIKLKEETINKTTKALIVAARNLAEQEGRKPEEVWVDIQETPGKMLPKLLTTDDMRKYVPESMQKIVETAQEAEVAAREKGSEVKQSLETSKESLENVQSTLEDTVAKVQERRDGVKQSLKTAVSAVKEGKEGVQESLKGIRHKEAEDSG